jgi:hypothetical protein
LRRQKPRRLDEKFCEHDRGDNRHEAANDEDRSPSHRQQANRQQSSQRSAERHTDDGQRDGERTMTARHELSGQRCGIRNRSTETEAGDESTHAEA